MGNAYSSKADSCRAYTFLFDADAAAFGGCYGFPCKKQLFDAILKLGQSLCTGIYTGDMLLTQLCMQISEVKKLPGSSSATYGVDSAFYVSLLTALVRSIKEREHVLAVPEIALMMGRHNIYAVTLCSISSGAWAGICRGLQGAIGFVGSFELDLGNPLHVELFIRLMIPSGFLAGGELCLEKPYDGEEEVVPDWAQEERRIQIRFLEETEYEKKCPPVNAAKELSGGGVRYRELAEKKGGLDPYQRLALALLNDDQIQDCQFSITGPFSWDQIEIPTKKLTEYALNPKHEGDGKSKALLFQKLLSITKQDWRYLAAQIENAMESGSIQNVRQTDYGVQFHIDIPIKGLNGISRIVRTGWIIRQPQKCSLTTAYILDKSQQQDVEGKSPLIVRAADRELFCAILYGYASNAGNLAVKNCIPTPMYVGGYEEPEMEGLCGFASVVIRDARTRFPKWLKKQGIGYLRACGGWAVFAEGYGQSYERAKAYADAFARVLRQNGVACEVHAALD